MKCYIDVDGVLNFYPAPWLEFIFKHTHTYFNTLDDAKRNLSYYKYTELKDKYRTSSEKANLPVRPSGRALAQYLHDHGWTIVVATSRPVRQYPKLIDTTMRWLTINNIPYDDIIFHRYNTKELLEKHPDIVIGIEDDLEIAHSIAEDGRIVFLLDLFHNQGDITSDYIIRVNSLDDIIEGWLE